MRLKKPLAFVASLLLVILGAPAAFAGEDATTLASVPLVGKIASLQTSGVGDIWSGDIPTSVQFPKTTTYPCGNIVFPIRALLPYSIVGDRAKGVEVSFEIWTDAGKRISSTSISAYNWNPVGPTTLVSMQICEKNAMGMHTLLIETKYTLSTNGLLSRYLSEKVQSKIQIAIAPNLPGTISNLALNIEGVNIVGTYSSPASDAPITSFEIGLADTTANSPIPPLGANVLEPKPAKSTSSTSFSLTPDEVFNTIAFGGNSFIVKVRAISTAGTGEWSNGVYFSRDTWKRDVTSKIPVIYTMTCSVDVDGVHYAATPTAANDLMGVAKADSFEWVVSIAKSSEDLTKTASYVPAADSVIGVSTEPNLVISYDRLLTYQTAGLGGLLVKVNGLNAGNKANGQQGCRTSFEDLLNLKAQAATIKQAPAQAPVNAAPAVSTPVIVSPVKVAAKKTISCVKGKTVKKVTASSPKCPVGYTKK
ncbi:unannotated protein [freshwater metagenome]|uniref:Unannotated protein n=2 Tax=freshwater metagenome TaxID=449393 RepID=A0A6J7ST41_9ZZZZ|nr:hypothetical protein [Actinomycetota bacterium]